jgi:tRNA nucleotidyltransferase (CCA-adding enzyme)
MRAAALGQGDTDELDKLLGLPPGLSTRSRLALLLRSPHVTNRLLQLRLEPALLASFIAEVVDIWQGSGVFDHDEGTVVAVQDRVAALAHEYALFWTIATDSGLLQRTEERPLLDGNAVTSALGCHPRLISQIQTFVLAWQYDQPQLSSDAVDKCTAWLTAEWSKGSLVPLDQRSPPAPRKADKSKKQKEGTAQFTAPASEDRRKRQKSE